MYNDHRADHKVCVSDFGTCVKWDYKGYEISLAMDGFNTCVFAEDSSSPLFGTINTDIEAIRKAAAFIDEITSEDKVCTN